MGVDSESNVDGRIGPLFMLKRGIVLVGPGSLAVTLEGGGGGATGAGGLRPRPRTAWPRAGAGAGGGWSVCAG